MTYVLASNFLTSLNTKFKNADKWENEERDYGDKKFSVIYLSKYLFLVCI